MGQHEVGRILLIVLTSVVWIVMVIFNALAGSAGQKLGIFKNTTGEISEVFLLQITPAGWTFSIWGVIYTWQALWLLYAVSTIWRQCDDGRYIYTIGVIPPVLYILYIINNLCNIAWLFVWDRQHIVWSLVVISILPLTLYTCLGFSFKRLYDNLCMLNLSNKKDIWLIRILVHNGLAIYAAWVTVATLLNVAMVMIYKGNVAKETACTVVLILLSFVILLWFFLDNVVFDKYTRYTFTPNITFVMAVAGSYSKNYNIDTMKTNSIFLLVLLCATSVLLFVKLLIMFIRHRKQPIMYERI